MNTLLIITAIAGTALLTGWAALIIQSLAGAGGLEPFFASELRLHCPPEDDDIVILDAFFGFVDSNGRLHAAPAGMHSDGASVGRAMRWLLIGWLIRILIKGGPLEGPLRPAAIPHDALYAAAKERTFWRALIAPARAIADRVIFEAACCGVYRIGGALIRRRPLSTWRAFAVMAILRLLGEFAWMEDSLAAQTLRSK